MINKIVDRGVKVVFLSTNLVYNVHSSKPDETSPVNGTCLYAKQKIEVEKKLNLDNVIIIRLSKILDSQNELFNKWIKYHFSN